MCDKRLIKTRKTDRRRTNTEAERYVFQTGKPTSPLSIIVLHWRIIPRQTCWALNFESVLLTLITFLARDGNQRRQTANQSSSIDRILIPTQRRIRDLPPPLLPGPPVNGTSVELELCPHDPKMVLNRFCCFLQRFKRRVNRWISSIGFTTMTCSLYIFFLFIRSDRFFIFFRIKVFSNRIVDKSLFLFIFLCFLKFCQCVNKYLKKKWNVKTCCYKIIKKM